MGEEVRIREYLIKYYKLVPEELPSPEVIEAKELLIPARFDWEQSCIIFMQRSQEKTGSWH